MTYNWYLLAADGILMLHFAFVAFVVVGFAAIWAGYFAKKKFIRNAVFRISHLLAIGFVVFETLLEKICPLTEWENSLRIKGGSGRAYETTFMSKWLHSVLFYDFSEKTFMVIYSLFFIFILITFWKIPPDIKFKKPSS